MPANKAACFFIKPICIFFQFCIAASSSSYTTTYYMLAYKNDAIFSLKLKASKTGYECQDNWRVVL